MRIFGGSISLLFAGFVVAGLSGHGQAADMSGYLEQQAAAQAASRAAAEFTADLWRAQAGDADAQFRVGTSYRKGWGVAMEPAAAANWMRESADQGNAAAQHALGEMYEAGEGVPRNEARALQWYRRSARQGHAAGQVGLATLMLNTGRGDIAEAYMWFEIAAAAGDQIGMRGAAALQPVLAPDALAQSKERARNWAAVPERQ
jgi:TPR repeat protein